MSIRVCHVLLYVECSTPISTHLSTKQLGTTGRQRIRPTSADGLDVNYVGDHLQPSACWESGAYQVGQGAVPPMTHKPGESNEAHNGKHACIQEIPRIQRRGSPCIRITFHRNTRASPSPHAPMQTTR